MKKKVLIIACLILIAAPALALAQERLRLSTTTSTENTGLLGALLPTFEKMFNVKVDVIAVGTGKALKLGENGDVDVVLVHAREDEDRFVADGFGVNRRDVMYNDYVVVGPEDDPAHIKGLVKAAEAFARIAKSGAAFISRGDESGTHKKEKEIWLQSGIAPAGLWYSEVGQGMGAVLKIADEKKAYTLSDRGTYLAFKNKIKLTVLCEGEPGLTNPYGIIAVNPARHPKSSYLKAMALIGWVTSQEGQKIIREFGRDTYGQPLFYPTAIQ